MEANSETCLAKELWSSQPHRHFPFSSYDRPPIEEENPVQLTKCYKKNMKLSTTTRVGISWHQTVLKYWSVSLIPSSRFTNFSTFWVHLFVYSAEPLGERLFCSFHSTFGEIDREIALRLASAKDSPLSASAIVHYIC
jgi:hypothetical protein